MNRLYLADAIDQLQQLEDESIDAVVTDPPYGLGFMGRQWDSLPPGDVLFKEILRISKPGAHLLAFGGTRTYHRLVCAIEDAGFEVRDCLQWIYGQGFPKSHNLHGEWQGWGTALKPSYEPIVLARKPLNGTVAGNVASHGTGALNIDSCRIETAGGSPAADFRRRAAAMGRVPGVDGEDRSAAAAQARGKIRSRSTLQQYVKERRGEKIGRWPTNLLLSHTPCCTDETCGPCCPVEELARQSGDLSGGSRCAGDYGRVGYHGDKGGPMPEINGDTGTAARFFPRFRYEAKASSAERNAGLDGMPVSKRSDEGDGSIQRPKLDRAAPRENWTPHGSENHHPTVKPVALMRWLCKLVTPPRGVILDPFMGSGTTGIAALREGFDFIGIEREPDYFEIAKRRIEGDMPLFNSSKRKERGEKPLPSVAAAKRRNKAPQQPEIL